MAWRELVNSEWNNQFDCLLNFISSDIYVAGFESSVLVLILRVAVLLTSLKVKAQRSGELFVKNMLILFLIFVYLTMLSHLIQLTHLYLNMMNFGNIEVLYMILKPKFMAPEIEVGINCYVITISKCSLQYMMRA